MHGLKFEVVKIQKANHHVHVAVTVPTLKKFKTQKSQNPKVKNIKIKIKNQLDKLEN